jgi:hypothetical protein
MATTLILPHTFLSTMSDGRFHCVCRTCPADTVAADVAGRADFFDAHADHEVLTVPIPTADDLADPEGRLLDLQAGD